MELIDQSSGSHGVLMISLKGEIRSARKAWDSFCVRDRQLITMETPIPLP